MTAAVIQEKYDQAPHLPGVYLMKDRKGKILYVGKAKDLKRRLSSYFVKKEQAEAKTAALLELVADFDLVITQSDQEAFILESNLIKEYAPKYNVILKDGKNYPLLRIDMNETYPAIERVRKIKNDKALYFGPYSSSRSVNQTVKQIQKIFKLRKCRNTQFKNRSRPCLNYQIKACLGLCCIEVDPEEYKQHVKDAVLFLRGRSSDVIKKLKQEMTAHAADQSFEKAAQVRDTIFAIQRVMERQVVVSPDQKDRDVMGLAWGRGKAVVTVMRVRSGLLIDTAHYPSDLGFKEPDEVLAAFVDQYYKRTREIPGFVLLSRPVENQESMESRLTDTAGRRVHLHHPVRGEKRRLAHMAVVNAEKELEKILLKEEENQATLVMLKHLLGMENLPERIECYDNSNIQGQDPVASMVVFTNGRPDKAAYRKFIIKDIDGQDDYAYMTHVLSRRFRHSEKETPRPDLVVVDGGKGQLGMAVAVLKELGMEDDFTVAGLAKKDKSKGEKADKIYLPGRSNPLNTAQAQKALFLLEQVRDEAHRFAITFQRKRREKRGSLSALDSIPGIGPKKKRLLLTRFKGVEKIKKQTADTLMELPGITRALAEDILTRLNGQPEKGNKASGHQA
ncbi:MAG: excinuclease ABC subunit UvrC [Desulfobacterales bacterium]|nr:excinuclease ABC subunit UvrC [Desulfobacterales bacterium]